MRVLFILLSLLCPLLAASAATPPEGPAHILFVGNSLSAANGGVDQQLVQLAASARPPRQLRVENFYQDGATLQALWAVPSLQGRIGQGRFSAIVLQEDLPETSHTTGVADFRDAVRHFATLARGANTRSVLFLAWPYDRLAWMTLDTMAKAHKAAEAELGLSVAPVGPAFQRSRWRRPELGLLESDAEHPNPRGTYLAAAVVYFTLFDDGPESLSWQPASIPPADALYLRRLAAESVRAWRR